MNVTDESPYCLRDGTGDSDGFYRDLSRFADEVLAYAKTAVMPIAEKYRRYVALTGLAETRKPEEYAFELLTLGVLWRTYGIRALRQGALRGRLIARLAETRPAGGRWKPAADRLRGALAALWLAPERDAAAAPPRRQPHMCKLTLAHMDRLLLWLAAAGEFRQEALRLPGWRSWWARRPAGEAQRQLGACVAMAAWFEGAAEAALGGYTAAVDGFRSGQGRRQRFREDAVLRDRRRVEYHLNLVGAEIMNRAFRDDFHASPRKAVLLPACMRAQPGTLCRGAGNRGSFRCVNCRPDCRVNRISRLGDSHSFEVIVVPHESDAFGSDTIAKLVQGRYGIVGVACPLNLMAGGWRAKASGIPAQCVILDYSGCKNHWTETGVSTDINLNQLLTILNIETDSDKPPSIAE